MPAPVETLTRAAMVRPTSLNREKRTVRVTVSTGAAVRRRGYVERVTLPDPQTIIGLPVLNSHRQDSLDHLIGRVVGAGVDDAGLWADITISERADWLLSEIEAGIITSASIGYGEGGVAESTDPKTRERVRTVTPVIREISFVPVPADGGATVRNAPMPKDNVTTEPTDRAALIQRCRAAHPGLDDTWATRMEEAGDLLTDDEVKADARETALAARAARPAPIIRTAAPANDDPAVIRTRQAEALAARMGGPAPSDAARPFMGYGLTDHAREALAAAGVATRGLGAEELLTRAMHGTSDFPALLTESGNRVLAAAYQVAQSPLKTVARQRTANDFRAMSILKLGEFSGLQKVTEHGEVKAMSTAEAKEGYSLETFGGIFSLSRKALVNDDLGAFGRWGELMGRAAAETEAAQLLALLTQASGAGPTMGDGVRLFHASHGNLAGSGAAPSEAALSAGRLAMRVQKGLDGSTPVNVVPRYILCGPALETTVEKLLATINPTASADVNVFAGRLTLLVEPRITGNAWYVFADPATAPVLEYAYLSSAPGPQLSSRDGWETLGREFRVILDFGCGATDHRGAYRNPGA